MGDGARRGPDDGVGLGGPDFDGRQSTAASNKRAVMVDLDTAAAPPVAAPGSVTYDRIPGRIPPGGSQSVFAGFYSPCDRFSCVSSALTYQDRAPGRSRRSRQCA